MPSKFVGNDWGMKQCRHATKYTIPLEVPKFPRWVPKVGKQPPRPWHLWVDTTESSAKTQERRSFWNLVWPGGKEASCEGPDHQPNPKILRLIEDIQENRQLVRDSGADQSHIDILLRQLGLAESLRDCLCRPRRKQFQFRYKSGGRRGAFSFNRDLWNYFALPE